MEYSSVIKQLAEIVGAENLLVDRDLKASYETDWTGRYTGSAIAVVRPANITEVQEIIKFCRKDKVQITFQGGNTGLVGGSIPLRNGIVLSTKRINQIGIPDDSNHLVVGSGSILSVVADLLEKYQLRFPVDLAARASATIGGMVSTNAGGINQLRFGRMRDNVASVNGVLGTGEISKDIDLFCGTEGILGLITEVELRAINIPTSRTVAILAFNSIDNAVTAAIELANSNSDIESVELFMDSGLTLVCKTFDLVSPTDAKGDAYLLIETVGSIDELNPQLSRMNGVTGSAVSTNENERLRLWRYRDDLSSAINNLGPPLKLDVSIPIEKIAKSIQQIPELVAKISPSARTWIFGHVCVGGLHVNVTAETAHQDSIQRAVFNWVITNNGDIRSEHGIGSAKSDWIKKIFTREQLANLNLLKKSCDPERILNTGVIFS